MTKRIASEKRVSGLRLARLDKIKNLLKSADGLISKEKIAEALGGISSRQVERDIDALEAYGVPVIRVVGRNGGYGLPEEYKLTPDPFSTEEIGTISVAGIAVYGHVDLIAQETLQNALAKIVASLPPRVRRDAELVAQRIHFDHSKWYLKYYSSVLLDVLKSAVLQDNIIRVGFQDWNQAGRQIGTIEPYGLVCKADTWYLVGYWQEAKIMRRFNLFRIFDVEELDITFTRKADFSLSKFWQQDLEEFGTGDTSAVLLIGYAAWERLKNLTWKKNNEFTPTPVGMKVSMRVDRYEWIIDLVLVNRGEVVVLEPPELRDRIHDIARRLMQQHSGHEPNLQYDLSPDSGQIGLEILESMSITSDS